MPKNTLTITTSNSQNWVTDDLKPLISSSTTIGSKTPTSSLVVDPATDQSLILHLKAPFGKVTTMDPANTNIPDKWGMLIMMNPKIKFTGPKNLHDNGGNIEIEV